ncbi:9935_t:CDS:2 [Paraglomus occultum]|uniref:9935_t:CDS:1 n=1 Tax=Paraglomus occultum TaxID=144539 RepID=A0A9N9BBY7_9GLOM|nr:9935_t:CDS:2 [Paraglomus occultum]
MEGVEESGETITLNCLVLGDHPEDDVFPITIAMHKTIEELKKFIAVEKHATFSEANRLRPWKVSIPPDNDEQMTTLLQAADAFSREGKIGNILSKINLKAKNCDDGLLTKMVLDRHIHVLIEHPAERGSPTKRRRLDEGWQSYIAADGQPVDLPPKMIKMLMSNKFKPDPRLAFSPLLNVQAGTQITITTMNVGQDPKHFKDGYQGSQFFVTEQMMDIWNTLASDSDTSIKKVLSGPMGVGKSYLACGIRQSDKASVIEACASTIFADILKQKTRKVFLIVDEHGALFNTDPPVVDQLRLLAAVVNHFHPNVGNYLPAIANEILRITNRVSRELVNLTKKIGTASLTLDEVKARLKKFEKDRQNKFFDKAKTHYDSLSGTSKEDTRLALADMFLPGETRVTEYSIGAAKEALLDLYKRCPLLVAYCYALASDKFDPMQFEDVLFQQLIRLPNIVLQITDLNGKHPLDMRLTIERFDLLQQPPEYFDGNAIALLPRISATHDVNTAKIENAFDRDSSNKNQIEYYLDAAFGGTHKPEIVTSTYTPGSKNKKKISPANQFKSRFEKWFSLPRV